MDIYDVSEHGNTETYVIQGSQSAPLSTTSLIKHIETMYNEGAPESVAEQGVYYPTAANYVYYCTGFESPDDWGDQHRVYNTDGPEVQFQGAEIENSPYVYYTPSYGYGQSPFNFNPYNPYIPGAMVGLDGSFMGPQQFITNSHYQDYAPSPYYLLADGLAEPLSDNNTSSKSRPNNRYPKHNLSSSSAPFTMVASESRLHSPKHFTKITDVTRADSRQPQPPAYAYSHVQCRGNSGSTPTVDNVLNVRGHSYNNQLKAATPLGGGSAEKDSVAEERSSVDKIVPESNQGRGHGLKANTKVSNDQNSKGYSSRKLIVKAYTSVIGDADAEGNITIHADQYNKEDLPIDYVNAKFFVIKSYSEDDVHKSIKYNVWSSTPNGNKKLNNAYEDAQSLSGGIPGSCPIFLFFSVNASGQFCGVAEMVGRVDFHRDMDFWQQDKWSGSFPVKWHLVKDVPNSTFRHITLANNENKPVTNSRDTQEIAFVPGREMLKIFKNHKLKSSILDDFMYYENRQKFIHDGRTRSLINTKGTSLFVPTLGLSQKLSDVVQCPSAENEKPTNQTLSAREDILIVSSSPAEDIHMTGSTAEDEQNETKLKDEVVATLMIGSMTIDSIGFELKPTNGLPSTVHPKPVEILTIGSMPVKVNGLSGLPGLLTFGSLPADIKEFKKKSNK